ncbi:Tat pathway signal sequence domain protein, partial [Streptomyces griseoincarnatus]
MGRLQHARRGRADRHRQDVLARRVREHGRRRAQGREGRQVGEPHLADPEESELDDPNAPRRADVTYYDYKDDTIVTKTVKLGSGKVERTDTQHGVQPPISRDEMVEAAKLLIADPLGAGLRADYKDATGKE